VSLRTVQYPKKREGSAIMAHYVNNNTADRGGEEPVTAPTSATVVFVYSE